MSSVGSALIVKRCGLRIRRVNRGARIDPGHCCFTSEDVETPGFGDLYI